MIRSLRGRLREVRGLGDGGALLIIAIVIVTVVALVTGVVLTRGDGSLRATVQLRDVARSSYAADAAAQVAINDLRTGYNTGNGEPASWYYTNVANTGCFGYNGAPPATTTPIDSVVLNNLVPKTAGDTQSAMSARVVCTADDATGAQGSLVPISSQNKPGYAIVTLNGPLNSTGSLNVHGGIYTNGNINGVVNVDEGDVKAVGSCTQTTAPSKSCTGSNPLVPDPDIAKPAAYAPDITLVPALQKPPTSCTSGVGVFDPGYYDSASAMTTATNLCAVSWFKPGTYYFDFHNDSCANVCPSNLYGTGGNTWRINGGTVIGGTRVGTTTAMPGSCVSPIDNVNAQGVQFVFGATSSLYVDNNSRVELCGTYHADRPPIVVYGLKTGSTPSATIDSGRLLTAVTAPGNFVGANVGNLSSANGNQVTSANLAVWSRDNTGNPSQSSSITATGLAPTTLVPKGAVVTAATLRVTHRSTGSANSFTFTPNVGTASISYTFPARANLFNESVDLLAGPGGTAFQSAVHDNGYTGATFKFDATLGKNQISQLDAVALDLTYYVPVLRGQSGTCAATGTACPLIDMKNGNNKILFYLQGTTYTPLSYLSILLGNFAGEVAKFGVIARQLDFTETNGNTSWTGPVFEIPDNTPGFGTDTTLVRLKVYLCPGATCTSGGELALESKVMIYDDTGVPGPPHRQMSVLSWSHTR